MSTCELTTLRMSILKSFVSTSTCARSNDGDEYDCTNQAKGIPPTKMN